MVPSSISEPSAARRGHRRDERHEDPEPEVRQQPPDEARRVRLSGVGDAVDGGDEDDHAADERQEQGPAAVEQAAERQRDECRGHRRTR